MTTITVNHLRQLPQELSVQQDWKQRLESRALPRVLELSDSDYVIFRTVERKGTQTKLVVLCQVAADDVPIPNPEFDIPQEKDAACWPHDPFRACLLNHYSRGALASLRREHVENFGDGELAFIDFVRHKVSFPVMLTDGIVGLAILVSGRSKSPYQARDALSLWASTQAVVSGQIDGDEHARLAKTVGNILLLDRAENTAESMQMLLRCLCSGHGLGWNRAWVLERQGEELMCIAALGESMKERWGNVVGGKPFGTLLDELAGELVNGSQTDELWKGCVDADQPARMRASATDLHKEIPFSRCSDAEVAYVVPEKLGASLADRFRESVRSAMRCEVEGLDPSDSFYACGVEVAGNDYVFVLSQNYTSHDRIPSLLSTSIVLHLGAAVLSDALDGPTKSVGEALRKWRDCFGQAFADPEEFDSRVILKTLQSFEQSGDFRAAARKRRGLG